MNRRTTPTIKYSVHSDFIRYKYMKVPLVPLLLPLANALLTGIANRMKPPEGIRAERRRVPGYQDGMIELTVYEPRDIGPDAPCLIYLHGGAFALKAAPHHRSLVCTYVLNTPCKAVFVDYRLAPRHAFPVGVEDCYAAFEWVGRSAAMLGIDRNRIAIGGDSAGGALAAAVNLMARDRRAPGICFQMLIYPVLDARQGTQSIRKYVDTPVWNSRLNEKMWRLYLKEGVPGFREYASPMEASSLENLPSSYIEVAEFDCLRDEGIDFAAALEKNGVPVELHQTTGTVHGFDMNQGSQLVQQSIARRVEALKRAFDRSR